MVPQKSSALLAGGALTPIGLINDKSYAITAVVDAALMQAEQVFHPLVNTESVSLRPSELLAFIRSCGREPMLGNFNADDPRPTSHSRTLAMILRQFLHTDPVGISYLSNVRPNFNTIDHEHFYFQTVMGTCAILSTTFLAAGGALSMIGRRLGLADVRRQRDADGPENPSDIAGDRRPRVGRRSCRG